MRKAKDFVNAHDDLDTPYVRAQRAWDARIGSARVQAKNWRLMALGQVPVLLLLVAGLLYQTQQATITPFVIEVSTDGRARALGPPPAPYEPTQAHIQYHLEQWITWTRAIIGDPVALRQRWEHAFYFVTTKGRNLLTAYVREHDPFTRAAQGLVQVHVTSIVPMSERSFEVEWHERTYDRNGLEIDQAHWRAIVQVVLYPPRHEDEARRNPLGIYIDAFAWSKKRPT